MCIERSATVDAMEDLIVRQYPQMALAMCGFSFARADKGRRLHCFMGTTLNELETFVAKGKLIVIPKRDLVVQVPLQQQQVSCHT